MWGKAGGNIGGNFLEVMFMGKCLWENRIIWGESPDHHAGL